MRSQLRDISRQVAQFEERIKISHLLNEIRGDLRQRVQHIKVVLGEHEADDDDDDNSDADNDALDANTERASPEALNSDDDDDDAENEIYELGEEPIDEEEPSFVHDASEDAESAPLLLMGARRSSASITGANRSNAGKRREKPPTAAAVTKKKDNNVGRHKDGKRRRRASPEPATASSRMIEMTNKTPFWNEQSQVYQVCAAENVPIWLDGRMEAPKASV